MKGKNGKQIGDAHTQRLEAYLASVEKLPSRSGKLNLSAVALACQFDRAVLYNNPGCRLMLEKAVSQKGLEGIVPRGADDRGDEAKVRLERRVHDLEQQNAALKGEVLELRAQLSAIPIIEEHIAETGRRIKP
jgi:hypothetical protein